MMNRKIKFLIIFTGTLFFTYFIFSQIGVLKMYKSSSIANEPNLKLNSRMFVSNLLNSENGDFICYNYEDDYFGKQIRVHRLLGKANDTIHIKNGIVYLNGKNYDKGIDYIHFYKLKKDEYLKIKKVEKISDSNLIYMVDEIYIHALLVDSVAEKYGLESNRCIDNNDKIDERVKRIYSSNWNKDNFGPLVIPNGKIFVIGDNRDNSEDSRFIGLLNDSQILGTVLLK